MTADPGLIVVTGGAGFIGRNVLAAINSRGNQRALVVDELGCGEKWRNLVGLEFEDVLSPSEFLRWLDTTDVSVSSIIHMGACSATTETDADYLLSNNYAYTRRLCEVAIGRSIRFIYASSAATYGDGSRGYSDEDEVTADLRPLNMYGYSKQMFDAWALRHGLLNKIIGLKFFNVFGPYEDHKADMRSVVAKAYDEVLANGSITLFRSDRPDIADGEQTRDFIYVKDVVAIILDLLDSNISGLFNCGTGVARTWLDLARAVFCALDRPVEIEFVDLPATLVGRYQYRTEANMAKLRKVLPRLAFWTLEDAVIDYVNGHLVSSR